jgi:hypothetical protein
MRRIVLSIFLLSCAFCTSLGCGPQGDAVADDQPACGIGTSPVGCDADAGVDAAAE